MSNDQLTLPRTQQGPATISRAQSAPPALPADIDWNDVRQQFAPNANEKEFSLFMGIAKSYGLNPFKREIHFSKYGNQASTIVGYEAFLKRAERTGLLDGWGVELGKDDLGEKATITIHRKDQKNPFIWSVYRQEFDTGKSTWAKMPLFMLRKVAIGQGFRLCFPEELGGMPYLAEEITGQNEDEATRAKNAQPVRQQHQQSNPMDQMDDLPPEYGQPRQQPQQRGPKPITDPQKGKIAGECKKRGIELDALCLTLTDSGSFGRDIMRLTDLSSKEASSVIDWLMAGQLDHLAAPAQDAAA